MLHLITYKRFLTLKSIIDASNSNKQLKRTSQNIIKRRIRKNQRTAGPLTVNTKVKIADADKAAYAIIENPSKIIKIDSHKSK